MAQVFDPLQQRLAPQQIQQFPLATAEQAAVLEHPGRQLIGGLRQRCGVADAQDRQTVGQLPGYARFVVRQLAVLQHVLRLIMPALQQLDDRLKLLRLELADEFHPGHFHAREQAVNAHFDLVVFVFPMTDQ
ncbi:hypothetical protein D3C81_1736530 [compost metagenome]